MAQAVLALGRALARRPAAALMASRTLVFAPHPDDEVLGCGGSIAGKVLAAATVRVVIMTDGRTSHARWMDAGELSRLRKAEALIAARELGLGADAYTFLDFTDGELASQAPAAIARVRELIDGFRPTEIYVPHHADVQPDHEATYAIVMAALATHTEGVNVYEYPVWLWNSWPWTSGRGRSHGESLPRYAATLIASIWHVAFGCGLRVDILPFRERKLRALHAYRSQVERLHGNLQWPIMSDVAGGEFLERLTGREETFRASVHRP